MEPISLIKPMVFLDFCKYKARICKCGFKFQQQVHWASQVCQIHLNTETFMSRCGQVGRFSRQHEKKDIFYVVKKIQVKSHTLQKDYVKYNSNQVLVCLLNIFFSHEEYLRGLQEKKN